MKNLLIGLLALASISAFAKPMPYITEIECKDGNSELYITYYGDLGATAARLYVSNELVFNTFDLSPVIKSENNMNNTRDISYVEFGSSGLSWYNHFMANIDTQSKEAKLNIAIYSEDLKVHYFSNGSLGCSVEQREMYK